MPKRVDNKWVFSDDEIDLQISRAKGRFKTESKNEPVAVRASFDRGTRVYSVQCENGAGVTFPVSNLRELRAASDKDIEAGYITPSGDAIHWDNLDAHYTVAGLVAQIFGTKKWMQELGKIGGRKTSEPKAIAARANGMKGGRPRSKIAAGRIDALSKDSSVKGIGANRKSPNSLSKTTAKNVSRNGSKKKG
jgi:hypothetical protein